MKALRKCIYLIFSLFVFGLVSCANDSSNNDTYVPARNTDTDKNGMGYRDGFYEFSDGNTTMYLYFENKSLVSAGNAQGNYQSSTIENLKQSYSWNTVSKYCTRYEVSLNSTKWMLGVYPAEKLFKKGWYEINISNNGACIAGYFENYNSSMSYTWDWHYGDGNNVYRTNNFVNNDYYSNKSWDNLLKDYANADYSNTYFRFLSENFNAYQERPSQN